MGKIKEYKGVIILTLVVLTGVFYWYEWRPSEIRKKCSTGKNLFDTAITVPNDLYINCLKINGLEK